MYVVCMCAPRRESHLSVYPKSGDGGGGVHLERKKESEWTVETFRIGIQLRRRWIADDLR